MPTYTFKIDLINTEPLMSRTIKVYSETTLYLMHHIVQADMGWENRHLYEFSINNLRFADSTLVDEEYGDMKDVKTVLLEDFFPKIGTSAIYLYDFGDGWKHKFELIEISNAPQNELLPFFVSGQNACPPEDCGGIQCYIELLEVLKKTKHLEYQETRV